ncbi:hypothetical protein [Clostridium aminobutyricum]|uniref:Uncharacterized protein n=1 Tax=Clostridium aminobutyricum TaxID=33953 RepID=A0A939D7C8_CLOAM|nr:hypothetical protein [Clostridium aminobutyricum]MBN7772455.1 hypothetical protein [Clostridium aminobutyricum]
MPNYSIQKMDPYFYSQSTANPSTMTCNLVYPEVYYKVQPFVMFACDQMQNCGNGINQKILDQVGENIYTNVCVMHPDIEEYANSCQPQKYSIRALEHDVEIQSNGGLFRRRGLFQDFVDLLLLNELVRRGTSFF